MNISSLPGPFSVGSFGKEAEEFAELAKTTFHSTSSAAACCAKEAGAGKLVLGHYSSRYKSLDTMLEEAKEIFPNTELAKEGMKFEIERDKFKE